MSWTYAKCDNMYVCKLDGVIEAFVAHEANAKIFCELMEMGERHRQFAMLDASDRVVPFRKLSKAWSE